MGLINAKNFVAPFQSKVHLVTIVMVTAVFVVLRFNGGGVSFSDSINNIEPVKLHKSKKAAAAAASKRRLFEEEEAAPDEREREAYRRVQETTTVQLNSEESDLIDRIMNTETSRERVRKAESARNAPQDPNEGKSLRDIEKSLGLR